MALEGWVLPFVNRTLLVEFLDVVYFESVSAITLHLRVLQMTKVPTSSSTNQAGKEIISHPRNVPIANSVI